MLQYDHVGAADIDVVHLGDEAAGQTHRPVAVAALSEQLRLGWNDCEPTEMCEAARKSLDPPRTIRRSTCEGERGEGTAARLIWRRSPRHVERRRRHRCVARLHLHGQPIQQRAAAAFLRLAQNDARTVDAGVDVRGTRTQRGQRSGAQRLSTAEDAACAAQHPTVPHHLELVCVQGCGQRHVGTYVLRRRAGRNMQEGRLRVRSFQNLHTEAVDGNE